MLKVLHLSKLMTSGNYSPYGRSLTFGHKLATAFFRTDQLNDCKLLDVKAYLVAGGRIELPTLGL